MRIPDRPGASVRDGPHPVAQLKVKPPKSRPIDMDDCHRLLERKETTHTEQMRTRDIAHTAQMKARDKAHAEERKSDKRLIRRLVEAIIGLSFALLGILTRQGFLP